MRLLRLTYEPEDQFHGELHAHVEVSGFSAESSAWFTRESLEDFSTKLRRPAPFDGPIKIAGGFWGEDKLSPADIHLGIVVSSQSDKCLVEVELSNSDDGCRQRAVLCLVADYSRLDDFSMALLRILTGDDDQAVVVGV